MYKIQPETLHAIEARFTYHPPFGNQPERYVALREKAKELAILLAELTPHSQEQSVAIMKLEECVMQANAAIARNERPPESVVIPPGPIN